MQNDTETRNFFAEGQEHGHAAATWVTVDREESAAFIITGYEDGYPEVMDLQPSPLSGEWAGESLAELGLAEASDEELSAYENGFSDGFWTELIRRCRYQISDEGGSASLSLFLLILVPLLLAALAPVVIHAATAMRAAGGAL